MNLLSFGLTIPALLFLASVAAASLVVAGIGLAIVALCRRAALPLRHALLVGTLVVTMVSPLLLAAMWRGGLTVFQLKSARGSLPAAGANTFTLVGDTLALQRPMTLAVEDVAPALAPTSAPSPGPGDRRSTERLGVLEVVPEVVASQESWSWVDAGRMAVVVWAGGCAVALASLVVGLLRVTRMKRNCHRLTDAGLDRLMSNAAGSLGMHSTTPLYISAEIDAPLSLGILRPWIVVPEATIGALSRDQLRGLLTHELAHIARRDHLVGLLQRTALVLFWWNPLVHRLCGQISTLREEICDDLATHREPSGDTYAAMLVELAGRAVLRRSLPTTIGMFDGSRREFSRRVERLLEDGRARVTSLDGRMKLLSGAVCLLLLAVACLASVQLQAEAAESKDSEIVADSAPAADVTKALDSKVLGGTFLGGTIRDDQGQPIAGAKVLLFLLDYRSVLLDSSRSDQSQQQLQDTLSDEQGDFQFKDVDVQLVRDRHAALQLIAQSPGKATAGRRVELDKIGERAVELKLPPAGAMRGRITAPDGAPVAGAIVSANCCGMLDPIPGICAAATDEDGRYEIGDLNQFDLANQKPQPSGDGTFMMMGSCAGQVRHPDFARQPFEYTKIPSTVDVTLNRAAVVEGQIVLAEDEQPAVGANIEFSNDEVSSDSWTRARTDERGRYRIANLPPGTYRVSVRLDGRANLFLTDVVLGSGGNQINFSMRKGGQVRGRVIDVGTGKPIELGKGESMSISESLGQSGMSYAGMSSASVQPDGTFTLLVQPGQRYFGMYFGPKWRGVNTDALLEKGIEVPEGQSVDLEIRVKRRMPGDDQPPQALSASESTQLAEQAAASAIKQLGGWVATEKIDGQDRVVEVNMVYHEDDQLGRQENRLISDECLSYVHKFPKLRTLLLTREQATDAALANVRGMESLQTVMIWDASTVTDAGVAHLAMLPNLKSIHVSNSQITDDSLRLLSSLQNLERLSLQGNHFTNRGLQHVKDMTQLKVLAVGLGKNEINDDGLQHISKLTNLECLDLQHSKVTDAGLDQLRGMNKLRDLWIGDTAVTPAGVGELRKSLPNLKEERRPSPPLVFPEADDEMPAVEWPKLLRGTIRDEKGQPVAGAKVRLDLEKIHEFKIGRWDETLSSQEMTTGADGEYRFDTAQYPEMKHRPFCLMMTVTADGYADAKTWNWYSRRDTKLGEKWMDVKLVAGRVVQGRVMTDYGVPVAGAVIKAAGDFEEYTRGWAWDPRKSDEDGNFSISVPRDLEGPIELWVVSREWAPQRVVLPKNGTELADVRLQRGATVSGRVTSEDGLPVSDAVVKAESVDDGTFNGTTFPVGLAAKTAGDGRYELPPIAGIYKLYLSQAEESDDRLTGRFVVADGPLPLAAPVKVAVSGSEAQTVDFRAGPGLTVSGTIRWADGRPVTDCEVKASYMPSEFGTGIWIDMVHTDANGRYEVRLPKPIDDVSICVNGAHDVNRVWNYAKPTEETPAKQKSLQFAQLNPLSEDLAGVDWVLKPEEDIPELQPGRPVRNDSELSKLERRYNLRQQELREALDQAKTPEERAELQLSRDPRVLLADDYLALEEQNRGTDTGLAALVKLEQMASSVGSAMPKLPAARGEMYQRLGAHYLEHPDLDLMFRRMSAGPRMEGGAQLLRKVIVGSPHASVKAAAIYQLACQQADLADNVDRVRVMTDELQAQEPKNVAQLAALAQVAEELRDFDPAAARKDAADLARRLESEFADVREPDRIFEMNGNFQRQPAGATPPADRKPTYGELAKGLLFDLERLQVGMPAPDVTTEKDGKPVYATQYLGKVTVLVFDYSFNEPLEQSITEWAKQQDGKPLDVLVVRTLLRGETSEPNQDAIAPLRMLEEQEGGPIAMQWGIRDWPSIFVVDSDGAIRGRGLPVMPTQLLGELLKDTAPQ